MLKKIKKMLIIGLIIFDILMYIAFLPAINIHSPGFYTYAAFVIIPFLVINIDFKGNYIKNKSILTAIIAVVAVFMLITFIGTPLLGGLNSYRNRITIPESSDFSEIEQFDQTQVQIIDKNISMSLADRVFGEMGADIVSQYNISDNYASVVVDDVMYRITPVEYSGLIKWISTNRVGTPGFISVNVTTGETIFHDVDPGLKYTFKAKFLHNMNLHLRLQYPTYIFGYSKFEVDDNWKPYWVSEVLTYSFVGKAKDVKGVVITDPCTGESIYYDVKDVPSWVDNVYSATLISDQYDDYGHYKNGLFNFSQRGQTAVTDDYAYLQKNGHLWMYTGVTSVGKDESNVGFIYVDLQNKDVIYIISAGAEEYSARASAEGAVQEKGYFAVFPTMVNIEDEPVYFMGLKDNAGLIKAYAFVSYKNYQKVGVGSTIQEALKNYTGKNVVVTEKTETLTITVDDIASAVIDGNSIYFIKTSENTYYQCSIDISSKLPFIKVNDILEIVVVNDTIVEIK